MLANSKGVHRYELHRGQYWHGSPVQNSTVSLAGPAIAVESNALSFSPSATPLLDLQYLDEARDELTIDDRTNSRLAGEDAVLVHDQRGRTVDVSAPRGLGAIGPLNIAPRA